MRIPLSAFTAYSQAVFEVLTKNKAAFAKCSFGRVIFKSAERRLNLIVIGYFFNKSAVRVKESIYIKELSSITTRILRARRPEQIAHEAPIPMMDGNDDEFIFTIEERWGFLSLEVHTKVVY